MSRHSIDGRDPAIHITSGWDNALRTFFAEVQETLPSGERDTVSIIGEEPGEYRTPDELAAAIAEYADLDEATLLALAEDRTFELSMTRRVDPDQFVMPFDQPDVEKEITVAVPKSAIESAIHQENMDRAVAEKPSGARESLQALWGFTKEQGAAIGNAVVVEGIEMIRGARNAWDQITNHGQDQLPRHFSPHAVKNEPGIHGDAEKTIAPAVSASPGQADLYGADHSLDERMSVAEAYKHAKNAPGVRSEIEADQGQPYRHTDAPDLTSRGSTYGASDVGPPMSPADRASLYGYEPEPDHSQEQSQSIEPQGPDR